MLEIKSGNLLLKLADCNKEYQQLWKLRYHELLKAYNQDHYNELEEDKDIYDEVCDHLIIVDTEVDEVIGTYRLIKKSQLTNIKKFLTETEYDITPLKKFEILEVGRAVIKEEYRTGAAISLLWKGVIKYAVMSNVDFMIGTASFHGLDPTPYLDCFGYLFDKHLSKEEFRCEVNLDSGFPKEMFKEYGVQNVKINYYKDSYTGRIKSSGSAFIELGSDELREKAIKEMHQKEFEGRRLIVTLPDNQNNSYYLLSF